MTGELLKRLRQAHGWTQEDLAAKLGVSRNAVSMIETGRSDTPAGPVLKLLAEVGWSPNANEADQAWNELVAATVDLGTAAARWDLARKRYAPLARSRAS